MKWVLTSLTIGFATIMAAGAAQADGELHIFNWGNYTSPDAIKKFEAKYNVKVTLDSYDSNDQMLAKVKAGSSGYDIVVPSSFVIPQMVADGLLAKTEPNQMENFKNMRDEFVSVYWDDGRHYTVPWQWGTTGISVNTEFYKGPLDSWSLLFNPPEELKGHLNVVPEMTDVMAAAGFYLGIQPCSDSKDDLKKISDLLMESKPNWRAMEYSTIENLKAKNFWASMDWNGSSMRARLELPTITYVYPKEGMTSWMDNVAVLADAPNLENAKLFQNFIMDPEIAGLLSSFARYDNGIKGALPADMVGANEVTPPEGFKYNFIPACPQAVAEMQGKIWNNLLK